MRRLPMLLAASAIVGMMPWPVRRAGGPQPGDKDYVQTDADKERIQKAKKKRERKSK